MAFVKETSMEISNINSISNIHYFLREYDNVLIGMKKTFSAALMAKESGPHMCAEILRKIFTVYFGWNPIQIRDCLTSEVAERMCLTPFIKRIPSPPEVNREEELYFVAWYLYPQTRNVSDAELVCKVYKDLMEGRIQKFPKNYFNDSVGYYRAKILFMTMLNEYFSGHFNSIEHLYRFFASSEGKNAIDKYKLKTPMQERYGCPLDYLHDSLPASMRTVEADELYEELRQKRSLSVEAAYTIWEPKKQSNDEKAVNHTDSDYLIVNYKSTKNLSSAKPLSFVYFNEDEVEVENWTQLYVRVFATLLPDYPEVFEKHINTSFSKRKGLDFADEDNVSSMSAPVMIADGFYLETELTVPKMISKIRKALDLCLVDYDNLEIFYSANTEENKWDVDCPVDEGDDDTATLPLTTDQQAAVAVAKNEGNLEFC